MNGQRKRIYPQKNRTAKAPLPTARPQRRITKAGLPASQVLFSLPKKISVAYGEKNIYLVYGGGSAPVLHGIPY